MWPIRFLLAVGLLSLAAPCSADMILTLTPTARIDFETQVQITYTLTGRAGGPGGQNVGEFLFRVAPMSLPTSGNIASVFNQTITPTGPWANPNFGIRGAFIAPINSRVSFDAFNSEPGKFSTIDATGGVVGTFDIIWNRPLTGQYDAAIPASVMDGVYSLTTSVALISFQPIQRPPVFPQLSRLFLNRDRWYSWRLQVAECSGGIVTNRETANKFDNCNGFRQYVSTTQTQMRDAIVECLAILDQWAKLAVSFRGHVNSLQFVHGSHASQFECIVFVGLAFDVTPLPGVFVGRAHKCLQTMADSQIIAPARRTTSFHGNQINHAILEDSRKIVSIGGR